MTYPQLEASRAQGRPVELYYFRYGSDPAAFYAYTDSEDAVTIGGVTYNPVPLRRGNIVSSGSLDKSRLAVNLPLNTEIVELFRVFPPSQVVTLTIYSGHLSDPDADFYVVWVGRVLQCSRGGSNLPEAELTCEPSSTSMRRTGLRRNYQLSCPHVLYEQGDNLCNADKAAATITLATVTVTPNKISFALGWNAAIPVTKYLGGIVTWPGLFFTEYRSILRIGQLVNLTLSGPTTGLNPGDSVDVSLGCNRLVSDCENLHNNIVNFGGQPFIPTKNPIRTNPFT